MLYMFQMHYPAEQRDNLQSHIEQRGIAGYGAGVLIKGAWVSKSRMVFALFDAEDECQLQQVCSQWSQFGDVSYQRVVDIDQLM